MQTGDGWHVAVQLSAGHIPPRWPDPAYPQQAHLDLRVPDLDAGAAKAAGLGAGLLRKNENWYTLADPAGHPFDLCLFPAKQETTLMGVMLDCPDAKELSTFYAELLGKPVTYESEGVAMTGRRRSRRGGGAEARRHLAVLRQGELAGLRRPGRQAVLPLLGLGPVTRDP
jgi:hypothetical protein